MILVDTLVWVDHLRVGDPELGRLLDAGLVLGHVFVRGELACGNLRRRGEVLALLADLPQAMVAEHGEVMALIDRHRLMGHGIGYVDAHLLTAGARLWTRAVRLAAAAGQLGVGLSLN